MTTSKDRPSAENLAFECKQAAKDMSAAASALRHGRTATAREKLQLAQYNIAYVQRHME